MPVQKIEEGKRMLESHPSANRSPECTKSHLLILFNDNVKGYELITYP